MTKKHSFRNTQHIIRRISTRIKSIGSFLAGTLVCEYIMSIFWRLWSKDQVTWLRTKGKKTLKHYRSLATSNPPVIANPKTLQDGRAQPQQRWLCLYQFSASRWCRSLACQMLMGWFTQPIQSWGWFFLKNGKGSEDSRVSEDWVRIGLGDFGEDSGRGSELKESLRSSSAISSRITVSSVSKAARSAAFVLHTFRWVVFQCWVSLSCHAFLTFTCDETCDF